MGRRELFENPTIARLQVVIESIRDGKLHFPDFQREFVWEDVKRRRLLDSLLKRLPVGSLLVWRTNKELAIKHELGPYPLPAPSGTPPFSYVLDGLQRLTTLYAAFAGEPQDAGAARRWPIYYDLEEDLSDGDETRFKLEIRRRDAPLTWLPLSVVFDLGRLYAHQKELIEIGRHDLAARAEHLALDLKDYQLALVPIRTDDVELAAQAFQRINSEGSRMGEPDMLRALTYRDRTFDLTARFDEIEAALPWGTLDHQVLVNTLKAVLGLSIYSAGADALADAIRKTPGVLDELERCVCAAVEFLVSDCRVEGEEALPYVYQLVALAHAAYRGADLYAHADSLRRWFWATTYAEHFSGMKDLKLRENFEHVRSICEGGEALPSSMKDADGTPRACTPLSQFNARSVRGLAFMHLLARRSLVGDDGQPIDGARLLARGPKVFTKLYPSESASVPGNRILVAPERAAAVRQLLAEPSDPIGEQLRHAHVLPPPRDPVSRNASSVLAWRAAVLRDEEGAFVGALGLRWEG